MAETQQLVRRLLETPDIARAVPCLHPEVLHRLIERCGLEDCAELVALATPRQIERVLDLDLWRAPSPGADETLDARRFATWLDVLLQSGAEVAGDMLAGMDLDLIVGGLMEHVRVFDAGAVEPYTTLDGERMTAYARTGSLVCEIGAYVVEARRPEDWGAIVEVLVNVQDARPAFFHRAMRACVGVSDGAREEDGFHAVLDPREQHRSDLATGREARRDAQGYVAPAQARAFLRAAGTLGLDRDRPPLDPIARASLRDIAREPPPAGNADEVEDGRAPAEAALGASGTAGASDAQAVTAVMAILSDAGVTPAPRALIGAGDAGDSRLALVRACIESRPAAQEELAFLVNALLAGCSIQDRPFAPQEASAAVAATCNLGLERWPDGWKDRDLVTAFQVGWTTLHRDVCRHAATTMIDVLGDLACDDRDVQWSLRTLRRDLQRHLESGEPWRARPALDAILMLDPAAWAVLRASLDECPAVHTTLVGTGRRALRVDPAAVTFVARNREIAALRAFLASLPSVLVG